MKKACLPCLPLTLLDNIQWKQRLTSKMFHAMFHEIDFTLTNIAKCLIYIGKHVTVPPPPGMHRMIGAGYCGLANAEAMCKKKYTAVKISTYLAILSILSSLGCSIPQLQLRP